MAKMIPPHWHDNTPRSEQRVFSLLQNDPADGGLDRAAFAQSQAVRHSALR